MRKGLYTSIVAVIAIALIAVIALNASLAREAGESYNASAAVADAKWKWQQAQYLLGKSAADAVADASYNDPICDYDNDIGLSKLNSYLGGTLNESYGECTVSGTSIDDDGLPNLDISLRFECTSGTDRLSVYYEKDIVIRKTVQASVVGTDCQVIVTDRDSGLEEVNQTAPITP